MYSELRSKLAQTAKSLADPSEGTTIATLILPALYAIGWGKPPDAWVEMHQQAAGGKQPDIGLVMGKTRKAGIEVKPLGTDLDADKHMSQAVGYAADLKVRWIILTDGFRWDLFDCKDLLEKDAEELRMLTATLADSRWERLAEALEPAQVAEDSLALFSAESTLVPIAQERWTNLTADLPAELVDLVLPAKEFDSFSLSLRQKAVRAAMADSGQLSTKGREPQPDLTLGSAPDERESLSAAEGDYYLLPVARKNEQGEEGQAVVRAWLTEKYWGLNKGTAYRQHFKQGDNVCFYASGVGVVAKATVAGKARERKPRGLTRNSDFYLPLESVELFAPLPLTPQRRASLDIMEKKSPSAKQQWVWLVQGTTKLTQADFERGTKRQAP